MPPSGDIWAPSRLLLGLSPAYLTSIGATGVLLKDSAAQPCTTRALCSLSGLTTSQGPKSISSDMTGSDLDQSIIFGGRACESASASYCAIVAGDKLVEASGAERVRTRHNQPASQGARGS